MNYSLNHEKLKLLTLNVKEQHKELDLSRQACTFREMDGRPLIEVINSDQNKYVSLACRFAIRLFGSDQLYVLKIEIESNSLIDTIISDWATVTRSSEINTVRF